MEKYDLHKNDFSQLHFELKHIAPYFFKHKDKASLPHRHSFYQILWFKNEGQHYIDYEVVKHQANTLFLINRNQIHYFCPNSSNEGYLIHFNDSFIANADLSLMTRFSISIFNEIGEAYIPLNDKQSEFIEDTSRVIRAEIDDQKENYSQIVMHHFIGLLYQIERMKKEQTPFELDFNSDFSKIVKFKQLILEHIDEHMSVQEFADELGLSTKSLTTLSKQYTSHTPVGLIKEMKILEAKRMLSSRSVSIKEVAYNLGFDQPTYFTKFFKKEVEMTPKEFQHQLA